MNDIQNVPPRRVGAYGLEEVLKIQKKSATILQRLRDEANAPDERKSYGVRFGIERVAEMVGVTSQAIRQAEQDGRLPAQERDKRGRRLEYDLAAVNRIRDHYGTRPTRADTDTPAIVSVQNFKGGVAKTTLVIHTAQYLAIRGYRVLAIDCDSQASLTTYLGLNPDVDVDEDQTLRPFLSYGQEPNLRYAVQETYFDGLHLIPANLSLYNSEYEIAAQVKKPAILDRLRAGVEDIAQDYDIVLMDPPPALGMISLSVIRAANGMLIPMPPSIVDYASTVHFLKMLTETLRILSQMGMERSFNFFKFIPSKVNLGKSAQARAHALMRAVFKNDALGASFLDSAEIDSASGKLMTFYELDRPMTKRDVYDRCRENLEDVMPLIEDVIRATWSGQTDAERISA